MWSDSQRTCSIWCTSSKSGGKSYCATTHGDLHEIEFAQPYNLKYIVHIQFSLFSEHIPFYVVPAQMNPSAISFDASFIFRFFYTRTRGCAHTQHGQNAIKQGIEYAIGQSSHRKLAQQNGFQWLNAHFDFLNHNFSAFRLFGKYVENIEFHCAILFEAAIRSRFGVPQ